MSTTAVLTLTSVRFVLVDGTPGLLVGECDYFRVAVVSVFDVFLDVPFPITPEIIKQAGGYSGLT